MISELEHYKTIREIALFAMFSDDYLMNQLVFKGGNLLDIVYDISQRFSMDLDFSIEGEFNIPGIENRIKEALEKTFNEAGYKVFDYNFKERPENLTDDMRDFWGGYEINFKIIDKEMYNKIQGDIDDLRRKATVISQGNTRIFTIDISKHEYCKPKSEIDFKNYTISVYLPVMIVFEKIRSICQQMSEYLVLVKKQHPATGRARDFFDIYNVCKKFKINLNSNKNIEMLKQIFKAKKVPLQLIKKIREPDIRAFHELDFISVKRTLKPEHEKKLKEFDYYFNYVVKICSNLEKALGII
jgi:predicted nucleotidyltransferase component of viral defense system